MMIDIYHNDKQKIQTIEGTRTQVDKEEGNMNHIKTPHLFMNYCGLKQEINKNTKYLIIIW